MKVIKDCIVTQGDAEVLREYVDSKSDPLYKSYKKFNSSLDLKCKEVYSMFSGLVVIASRDPYKKTYTTTIRYSNTTLMSYSNLKSLNVSEGDEVDVGDLIGIAQKFVSMEYLNFKTSLWPVRIWNLTYYKQDPYPIIESGGEGISDYLSNLGDMSGYSEIDESYGDVPPSAHIELTDN